MKMSDMFGTTGPTDMTFTYDCRTQTKTTGSIRQFVGHDSQLDGQASDHVLHLVASRIELARNLYICLVVAKVKIILSTECFEVS